MASFTAGTTFTDGVANDVTAAKLGALVTNATPTSGLIQDRTTETVVATNDSFLIGDASDSNNLKKMTVANVMKAELTGTINSTTGTITTGVIPTLTSTTLITTGTGTAAAPAIVPTGDTNTGIFFPAADTIAFSEGGTESMRIDSSGNVGIGTASPSGTLDVNGSAFVRGYGTSNTTITSHNGLALGTVAKNTSPSGGQGSISILSNDASNRLEASVSLVSDATAESRRLAIGIVEQGVAHRNVTIAESGGNVGIGTASPATKLHVEQGTTDSGITVTNAGGAYKGRVYFDYSTNQFVIDSNGDVDLRQGQGTNNGTGDLALYTALGTGLGGTGASTEKMRITGGGNVGIGTASPSAQLELSTDSAKKPSTNTWTIASDQRLKTNITNADNDRCYEIVKQVPLKRYSWKNEVYSQEQVRDRSKLGWIAQDVEAVFPKAVGTNRFAYNQVFEDVVTPELDSDGNAVLDENGVAKTKTEKRLVSEEVIEDCKDLNSDQIYAAMYGTIQKLIEKVETLEAKVAVLEAA